VQAVIGSWSLVAGRWRSEAFGDQWTFISEIMLKDKGK
jgi:hypothetical protein